MKRISILLFLCIFVFTSCSESRDPTDGVTEFVSAYGARGIVYSTSCAEGEEGYITEDIEKAFFGNNEPPENYAIFLNTHLDYASECGAFLVEGDRNDVISICQRRVKLLDPEGSRSFIVVYKDTVFYSTMSDKDKAKKLADIVFQ